MIYHRQNALDQTDLTAVLFTVQVRPDSSGLPVVHHSRYVCELPAKHRFPMGKFPRVLHWLIQDQVITDRQVRHSLIGQLK